MRHHLFLIAATLAACGGSSGASNSNPPRNNPAVTSIQDVQGTGAVSPLDGQTVTIEGVVTGLREQSDLEFAE